MATNICEELRAGLVTRSAADCEAAAAAFARTLPPDTTLALHGDLGVGKTTFVRGLARGLGIQEPITSPTFSLYTLYRSAPGPRSRRSSGRDLPGEPQPAEAAKTAAARSANRSTSPAAALQTGTGGSGAAPATATRPHTLLHLDAYRIESAAEVEALLLEDFLQSPWCLAIEWPGKIAGWLPANTLHLTLSINPTDHSHTIYLHQDVNPIG